MDAQTKAFAEELNIDIRVVLEGPARARREELLRAADRLIQAAEDDGRDPSALIAYRQKVRDIPQQATFPERIEWPEVPA